MCFHYKQTKEGLALEKQFKAKRKAGVVIEPVTYINGFEHPKSLIITNDDSACIQNGIWGLMPNWTTDLNHQNFTLNARIEDMNETASYKNNLQNRCLILADGFYEWQWQNSKGTHKKKFEISLQNDEAFAFAGIYEFNKNLNEFTFSMVTTQANVLMSEIHNVKKRMPVILKNGDEFKWLNEINFQEFAFPYEVDLKATPIEDAQLTLF